MPPLIKLQIAGSVAATSGFLGNSFNATSVDVPVIIGDASGGVYIYSLLQVNHGMTASGLANFNLSGSTGSFAFPQGGLTGTFTYGPSNPGPITYGKVVSDTYQAQTTPGSHTAVAVATIPLPGTEGADVSGGALNLKYQATVTGTTTAVGAQFEGYVTYAVQTPGAPAIIGTIKQPIADGSASGGSALPAGWSFTLALDGTSHNILLKVTTDAADTYDGSCITQKHYVQ